MDNKIFDLIKSNEFDEILTLIKTKNNLYIDVFF